MDVHRCFGEATSLTLLEGVWELFEVGVGGPNDGLYLGVMGDDTWASLADQFADETYASVKGRVRTYVLHEQLLEHLPASPARLLDVGGGAGHQSFPLAHAGYDVTLFDSSPAMLAATACSDRANPWTNRPRFESRPAQPHAQAAGCGFLWASS